MPLPPTSQPPAPEQIDVVHEQRALLEAFRHVLFEQKALVDQQQERIRKLSTNDYEMELSIRCPISGQIFEDPVFLLGTGRIFEREAVELLISTAKKDGKKLLDPLSGNEISGKYETCYSMKSLVDSYLTAYPEKKEHLYQKGTHASARPAKLDVAQVSNPLHQFFRASAERSLIRLPALVALCRTFPITVVDQKIQSKVVLDGDGAQEYYEQLLQKKVAVKHSTKENVRIVSGEGITFELHVANDHTSSQSLYTNADFILCFERTPEMLRAWMRDINELKQFPEFKRIDLDDRSQVLLNQTSSLEGIGVSGRMFALVTARILYSAYSASKNNVTIRDLLVEHERKMEDERSGKKHQNIGGMSMSRSLAMRTLMLA